MTSTHEERYREPVTERQVDADADDESPASGKARENRSLEDRMDVIEDAVEDAAEGFVEGFADTVDKVLPPHLRARAWARRRRSTHILWQAGVLLVGLGLVVAGIAMLVLPGPGWAAIILGLVVLASEYAWARRLLDPVQRWARAAARTALDPAVRRRNMIIAVVVVVVIAGLVAWYVVAFGPTLQPITGLVPR